MHLLLSQEWVLLTQIVAMSEGPGRSTEVDITLWVLGLAWLYYNGEVTWADGEHSDLTVRVGLMA